LRAFKEILQIFIPTHVSPSLLLNDVETLIKWSQKFKVHHQEKRPFRQLEELFSNYKDPDAAFMKTAIAYLLENYKSEKLKSILNNLVDTMFTRSQVQVRIIRTMGNIASVFGALGSLMSIIMALSHPYSATSQLLNALAASLVPMLYGFVLAYLIFKPAARKLEQKNEMRRFRNQLLSCGFVLLSDNSSALEIEDTLNSFLDPQRNFHIVARS
jgi:chemotaxis protein MotA